MASILAIRDLRTRVRDALRDSVVDDKRALRLLALDPLATLRCLRVAHAPVNRHEDELLSVPNLYRALGRAVVVRAMRARVHDPAGTTDIRRLWLHGLATAHAARSLAAAAGDFDPEKAYLLGLLHDLPLWVHYLGRPMAGENPDTLVSGEDWLESWHLPPTLRAVIDRPAAAAQSALDRPTGDASALIAAAELLAELADFWHPGEGDQESRNLLLSLVTKEDLVAAHNLRQEVAHALEEFGLTLNLGENADLSRERGGSLELFHAKSRGDIAEVVLSLLGCRGTQHYREILTAATSACLRYLDFERVYFVQWIRPLGSVVVRAKADLSPRRLVKAKVELTKQEIRTLTTVHQEDTPGVLQRESGAAGLMRLLGSSEALIAPINRDFDIPSFLIMDRALSSMPIDLREDGRLAQGLAGAVSMLTENLMLKKLRDRAEKYALTDPLTRLYNRTVGISSLAQAQAQAKRTNAPLTVLMIDIDDFKRLNDTRGHVVGDMALRQTADVMRRTLRRADVLCRYGGEEFLVVLPDTSTEEATISAARLFTAVADAGERLDLPLTISIGLAEAQPEDNVESLLARADGALYASKSRGRNRFSVDVG